MYSTLTIIAFCILILSLLISYYNGKEEFYTSIPNSISNKFSYPASFISNDACGEYCKKRYESCSSYYPVGNSNWCNYLNSKCKQDCKWNSVFTPAS